MRTNGTSGVGRDIGGRPDEQRRRFGRLLAEALSARGRKQEDLAKLLGTTQSSVSAWVTGRYEPSAATVFAIERSLSLGPGYLSRALGYLPLEAVAASPGVEDAVAQSTLIDDDQKRIVLAVYQAVLQTGGTATATPTAARPSRAKAPVEDLPASRSPRRAHRRTG